MDIGLVWGKDKGKDKGGKGKDRKGKDKGKAGKDAPRHPGRGSGKGSGKDKGKSKGDARGSGQPSAPPTPFAGYCGRCGAWGHMQKHCRVVMEVAEETKPEPREITMVDVSPSEPAQENWIFSLEMSDEFVNIGVSEVSNEFVNVGVSETSSEFVNVGVSEVSNEFVNVGVSEVSNEFVNVGVSETSNEFVNVGVSEVSNEFVHSGVFEARATEIMMTECGLPSAICTLEPEKHEVVIDSGAGRSVCGPSDFPDIPMEAIHDADAQVFRTAKGDRLTLLGRKRVKLLANDVWIFVCFTVLNVMRPILSVEGLVSAGFNVIFNEERPEIRRRGA
eukprot:4358580-Amphidinium_carterae.1